MLIKPWYDDVKDRIVQPHNFLTVNRYFLHHWLPVIGPAQAWFIAALRDESLRVCAERRYGKGVVPVMLEAMEVPLAQLAVNAGLSAFPFQYHNWFFTQQASNLINIRLDMPLTPHHLSGLSTVLRQAEKIEPVLKQLLKTPVRELLDQLDTATGDPVAANCRTITATIRDKAAIPDQIRRLYELQEHITYSWGLFDVPRYFLREWVPILGPDLAWLVVLLRSRLDNYKAVTWRKQDIARILGLSTNGLAYLLVHPDAAGFFKVVEETADLVTVQVNYREQIAPVSRPLIPGVTPLERFYSALQHSTGNLFSGAN